jgi:hypothetical protein
MNQFLGQAGAMPVSYSPATDSRRPWVLISLAGIAGVLAIQSLFGNWITKTVTVTDVAHIDTHHGLGYFGGLGVAYGIGVVLLGVATGLALWLGGRGLAWGALALAGLLFVDLGLVAARLSDLQSATAGQVARLRDSVKEGLPTEVAFHVTSPAMYSALAATFLCALVAAQLLWPAYGIRVQVSVGVAAGVGSAVLPWAKFWTIDDKRPEVPYQVVERWLWSGAQGIAIVVEFLLLIAVTLLCLRAPGYARARWAVAAVPLTGLIFFGVVAADNDILVDAEALQSRVSEVPGVFATGAGPLLVVGAVLLLVAAVRAWSHGREEDHSSSDSRWLPETIREHESA